MNTLGRSFRPKEVSLVPSTKGGLVVGFSLILSRVSVFGVGKMLNCIITVEKWRRYNIGILRSVIQVGCEFSFPNVFLYLWSSVFRIKFRSRKERP